MITKAAFLLRIEDLKKGIQDLDGKLDKDLDWLVKSIGVVSQFPFVYVTSEFNFELEWSSSNICLFIDNKSKKGLLEFDSFNEFEIDLDNPKSWSYIEFILQRRKVAQ
jgi:hypothetical protein